MQHAANCFGPCPDYSGCCWQAVSRDHPSQISQRSHNRQRHQTPNHHRRLAPFAVCQFFGKKVKTSLKRPSPINPLYYFVLLCAPLFTLTAILK
jgi:hypothetical protein